MSNLYNYSNSRMAQDRQYNLPTHFILKRFKPDVQRVYPELASHSEDAVLIRTTRIGANLSVYDSVLVNEPLSVLGSSLIQEDTLDHWFDGNKVAFTMKCGDTILNCTFEYNKMIINSALGPIPVMRQSSPCELYGNTFVFIHTDIYEAYRFPCKANTFLDAPLVGGGGGVPIMPLASVHKRIPQHILNTYIQTLLDKEENCPVEMMPLTKESVRITPCGHALSVSAAECWIAYKHSCPVCREECSLVELQQWV